MLKQKVESDLQSLRETFNTLNDSISNLDMCLHEHKQQTIAELAHLQTSISSTNSKLDSLAAAAAQLSSDHRGIQANISDVERADTQQSLQIHQNMHDNLTHQLEKIWDDVMFVCEQHRCGGHGWRRVVFLNMTDLRTACPSGWKLTGFSKRTCGRVSTGVHTCDSTTFPAGGGVYSRVCGRIRAYQWGASYAFFSYHLGLVTNIDGAYASGVSLTHGTPRNHIWTFVAGKTESNPRWFDVCPCDSSGTIRIPPFVGNDYVCESGINEPWGGDRQLILHSNDTLWDGEDCLPSSTCCSQYNPPYFTRQLPTPTANDIEARICQNSFSRYSNLAVELVELYVQ